MTREDQTRWDQRYSSGEYPLSKPANPLLTRWAPPGDDGLALDLACGPGHNARWLVRHGYQVLGVDISRVALGEGIRTARAESLAERVLFVEADLDQFVIPPGCFDLISVFRFLDRRLFPMLREALRPGGLLIVETLNVAWRETHPGPPEHYLLEDSELTNLASGMHILSEGTTHGLSHVIARSKL
jgi:tellurite methyltransferase